MLGCKGSGLEGAGLWVGAFGLDSALRDILPLHKN